MYPVKQSVSLTIPVFAHDVNGDAVLGLLNAGFTKRISKNGAAFGAMTITITEMENGFYSLPLDTGHTDTTGVLTIILTHASCKQINIQLRVHARLPDDLAYPTVSGRSIDVDATGGVEITPNQAVNAAQWAGAATATDDVALSTAPTNFSALSITAGGLVDITQAAADKVWSSATRTLTAFSTALAVSVWDVLETAILTASSIGLKVKNNLDVVLSTRASQASVDAVQADTDNIQTRIPTTLVGGRMDSSVGAMAANTLTASALATDAVTEIQSGLSTVTTAQVNAEVVDALNVDTYAEPAAVPAATATLVAKIGWLAALARNKLTQTATTQTLRNDADNATIAASTISDDGTTFTRGKFI